MSVPVPASRPGEAADVDHALPFGYGFATAALYGSLWASHTLVSYPIVQEHGLTRQRAVGMASGCTLITDTLALFVLAVVVGSHDTDDRPALIVLRLVLGLVALAVYCGVFLRLLGRFAFARLGDAQTPRFLFLLAALTSAALVADRMGLEGMIGAFFAGLALNKLVSVHGPTSRVSSMEGMLLIPFFLLSTRMLLVPAGFTKLDVLLCAGSLRRVRRQARGRT